jgi:hypothetical protein
VRACLYKGGVLLLPVNNTKNTTNNTMGQPVSKMVQCELLDPVPPDEYYAKRLLQPQTLEKNNDTPEHIRNLSIVFHQLNAKPPRTLNHFRELVTAHETLLASFNHTILHTVPKACSACSARFQKGSEILHKKPKCNPLHLTSLAEQFYSLPPPDYRRDAFDEFKALLAVNSETSLLGRLGAQDARSVSPSEYVCLLDNLSVMFFPVWGKRMMFNFTFLPEIQPGRFRIGSCKTCPKTLRSLIKLFPTVIPTRIQEGPVAPPTGALNSVSTLRLCTLLHEMCHAFLRVHARSRCPEYVAEVDQMNGHGFA